ncbi:MAG: SCP2 sterol-binding domain-containing protein [Deltaproteobacteria bacterium]|nr:SCP2 sterol-binding domain-containing protein [Deltaproteobacteria bacterium]MBI3077049.1 SCP2 sterol-binding domain-containing protein [Deltaproteobacteria bacterium]
MAQHRTLAEYVVALVERLAGADPLALARIRQIVGRRRARIVLDDEAVDIVFGPEGLLVGPPAAHTVDGEGITDRSTVLDLLDGYLEVTDAILDGRVRISGDADNVARMLLGIEILLDGASRIPSLQALARDFRADPLREPPGRPRPVMRARQTSWYPADRPIDEDDLLFHLGLLPGSHPINPRVDEPSTPARIAGGKSQV